MCWTAEADCEVTAFLGTFDVWLLEAPWPLGQRPPTDDLVDRLVEEKRRPQLTYSQCERFRTENMTAWQQVVFLLKVIASPRLSSAQAAVDALSL